MHSAAADAAIPVSGSNSGGAGALVDFGARLDRILQKTRSQLRRHRRRRDLASSRRPFRRLAVFAARLPVRRAPDAAAGFRRTAGAARQTRPSNRRVFSRNRQDELELSLARRGDRPPGSMKLGGFQLESFSVVHSAGAALDRIAAHRRQGRLRLFGRHRLDRDLFELSAGADLFLCECSSGDQPIANHLDWPTLESQPAALFRQANGAHPYGPVGARAPRRDGSGRTDDPPTMDGCLSSDLAALTARIRACRICRDAPRGPPLPHEPRPVLRVSSSARLLIAGQAPGPARAFERAALQRCVGRSPAALDGCLARDFLR